MDVIILIFLCWRMRNIVLPKGYKPLIWQILTALVWLGGHFVGIAGSFLLGKSLEIMLASGYLCAILGYLILQQYAKSLENISNHKDQPKTFE
jgi:positive regulator of sigma E activity